MNKSSDKSLQQLSAYWQESETEIVELLTKYVKQSRHNSNEILNNATKYSKNMRENIGGASIESFFRQYGLDSDEGAAIMSMAESLLRVPDKNTANDLIRDKIQNTTWKNDTKSSSHLMQASAAGVKFINRLFNNHKFLSKAADPIIRKSVKRAMRILGKNFVIGEDIKSAYKRAKDFQKKGYLLSYDMLGEGARSEKQAKEYLHKYLGSIKLIKRKLDPEKQLFDRPGISVKLSALHSRFELANHEKLLNEITTRLKDIITQAMVAGIPITIDAEESARLDITLQILEKIISDPELHGYDGIGIAVQSYHKNATKVIEHIADLAKRHHRPVAVRLVKGAYWDSEIKKAQMAGLEYYPVFTQKHHTDISYLACAYKLLEHNDFIYPQFATHNALTIAEIETAAIGKKYEFQLLYGMGSGIYDQIVSKHKCRIYAPVGKHKELLPYLIRRLLENSASTSFVKKIADNDVALDDLIKDPLRINEHSDILLPEDIYKDRRNSIGIDLGNLHQINQLQSELQKFTKHKWKASPVISGATCNGSFHNIYSPHNMHKKIGRVVESNADHIKSAIDTTSKAFEIWTNTDICERANILTRMADLIESNKYELMALCIHEAGKTIGDAIAEIREAADFCRYYAAQAKKLMSEPQIMPGPTGESNKLSLHGRGVFMCVSPWNFPLAIFLGQVTAALVTGNTVIAKPAEQTPLIAAFAVKLLFEAGLPQDAIALLPGDGEMIGRHLLNDERTAGVVFTGSVATAKIINKQLASRTGAIVPFIAETGGQNAMIVDSSALIEQTVDDIIISAFGSAGQRCSALRVLYVQEDIADELLETLSGAIENLKMGNPEDISVNVGAVIDQQAKEKLQSHIKNMAVKHKKIASMMLPTGISLIHIYLK
jgi:RHH-type proline utilization regulon transcriptional repressor/proline dehydrogenase/delta 1-pyrroline-5-carboxylate dehydrogenase